MTRDIGGITCEIEARLRLEHADRGKAHGHQSRLGISREREIRFGTFEHQAREILAECIINLSEDGLRLRKAFGERLAHADCLTALTRKCERRFHGPILPDRGP